MRNGCCSQFITLHFFHSFLIAVFTCSGMGFLPWDTALYKHFQHQFFPRTAVLEELLQNVSYPWGIVLQEWTDPAWVSLTGHNFCWEHASAWMLHGFLQEGAWQIAAWISLLYSSMNCRGTICCTILHGLEMSLRSSTQSISLPPCSLVTAAA